MDVHELIAGRYRLERKLGSGGMATVWRAHDKTLARPVAIKFLSPDKAPAGEDSTERFLREARIAAAVRHRNVIQILDFGTHAGNPYIIMEALEGESMALRFDRRERFELRELVDIAVQCLEGLAAVHEAGIVHRDLKPENIFLAQERELRVAKLLDFGISRSVDRERPSAVTTEDGRIIGTPEYMSPEQARGLPSIDLRTDLYSMGVVLYEGLTGRAPYESQQMGDLLIKVVSAGAPPIFQVMPELGPHLSEVVQKAMRPDPAARYANANQMRDALIAAAQKTFATGVATPKLPKVRSAHRAEAKSAAQGSAATAQLAAGFAMLAAASSSHAARRRAVLRVVLSVALAGAALVLGIGLGPRLLGRSLSTTASAPRYIVVQSATPAPEAIHVPAAVPPASETQSASLTNSVAATSLDATAHAGRTPKAPTKQPAPPPPNPSVLLARSFDRQKDDVVHCLEKYPEEVTEGAQLAVRMTLDSAGSVRSTEVLPESIAKKPMGACIAAAVQRMRFGPQPSPISMRVPLTAHRE